VSQKTDEKKVRVLFIAGEGKSGSSLLAKILGQIDGFVDVGELIMLHQQTRLDWKCGCGVPFSQCTFWKEIADKSVCNPDGLPSQKWGRLRSRYLPTLFVPGLRTAVLRHFEKFQRVYHIIGETSHANVIIDSSKSLFPCYLLALFPTIELYVIHLVRDIRGTENSNHRLKMEGSARHTRRGPWTNSIRWILINLFAEILGKRLKNRYAQVRYEDLISNPKKVLTEILLTLEEEKKSSISFVFDDAVMLKPTHSISGSRIRFKNGRVVLRLDERWKTDLPSYNLRVVRFVTKWFKQRYGY
jgi:hypothetical protein